MISAVLSSALANDAPGVASSRVFLEASFSPAAHQLVGTATIQLVNTQGPVRFLLNSQLVVTSVRDGTNAAAFSEGDRLNEARWISVELDNRSGGSGPRVVAITYEGTVAPPGDEDPDWMGALVIRADEVRMTEQTRWYPMLNGARGAFAASITLPADFLLAGPGVQSRTTNQNGHLVWGVQFDCAVAPALVAGKYRTIMQPPAAVYVFEECAAEAQVVLKQSLDIAHFFERQFGPRPFDQISICQMRVRNPGFSYNFAAPGVVVLPTEIMRMASRPGRREFWTRKLAHEIAHQWWGCAVNLAPEQWPLHESLSELAAVLYLQSLAPEKPLGEFLSAEAEQAQQVSAMARAGTAPDPKAFRKCLAYQRGPWVLLMLRHMLGEPDFDRSLRTFYRDYAFRQPTLDQFQASFGPSKTMPLEQFFLQWAGRPVLPRLTLEASDGGEQHTLLTLKQAEPVFGLPVDLRLRTPAGALTTNCLLTKAEQQLRVPLSGPVLSVEIDPGKKLLLERHFDTSFVAGQLGQAATAYTNLLGAQRADQRADAYAYARELRDIFRQLLYATDVEQVRARLAASGPLDARTKVRLDEYAQLRASIERFFGQRVDPDDLRRIMRDLAESADDIHDSLRDNRHDGVDEAQGKLTKTWEELCKRRDGLP